MGLLEAACQHVAEALAAIGDHEPAADKQHMRENAAAHGDSRLATVIALPFFVSVHPDLNHALAVLARQQFDLVDRVVSELGVASSAIMAAIRSRSSGGSRFRCVKVAEDSGKLAGRQSKDKLLDCELHANNQQAYRPPPHWHAISLCYQHGLLLCKTQPEVKRRTKGKARQRV